MGKKRKRSHRGNGKKRKRSHRRNGKKRKGVTEAMERRGSGVTDAMERRGSGVQMQALEERNQMHTRERSDMQNVERGSEQCQAPWKAVDCFQKCYQYKYSDDAVQYIDANDICIRSKPGARLFTPGSPDEMKKVDEDMIPSSVSGSARSFWTGYVEYAWQLANPKGPLQ